MMLATVRDYMHPWQVLLLLAYIGAWLAGGPHLTRWALRRFAQLPRSKASMTRSIQINFFAGGAALIAVVITLGFFLVLAVKVGPRWLVLGGVLLAPLAMIGTSLVVHLTILNLPSRTTLRLAATTTVPALVLLVLLGIGAFAPAWYIRQATVKRNFCHGNLLRTATALKRYAERLPGQESPSLEVLVEMELIERKIITCPGREDGATGYLYLPTLFAGSESSTIRICDRRGNHRNLRMVLFADQRILGFSEDEFQELLALPENAAMRELDVGDR